MSLVFQQWLYSNCLDSQINSKERLLGDAKFIGIAETVDNYQLAFDVWSKTRQCAAADIVAVPDGTVWGALYEIPDYLIERQTAREKDRKSPDAIEGTEYGRVEIDVQIANGTVARAITYRVIEPQLGLKTSHEYVGYILCGLRGPGAPEQYVQKVKRLALVNNPAIGGYIEQY
jgi:hypothetical protein